MSYQVLARKWRPRFFREMVGQEHVLQALINALDHNRLHHAYLFTGTRGVGKTTIARILAKCLNCEQGVSSEPCGTCSACKEINDGCFVDLIEVDAASRTKVEDTRELLDNVQYAPTKGRYKVYLIDEVHMLSTHSFNALLKTLEEPPEHVKFLLATTDPQKLPATILSRCLQFHLKNMPPESIVAHLNHILQQEIVEFEEQALWALARSANGSMRDALSLTDQAVAFGSGKVQTEQVQTMLGSIDLQTVYLLADALIAHDGAKLLQVVKDFAEHAPDYEAVLDELLLLLHRLSIAQIVPNAIDNSLGDQEQVLALAGKISAEELQLFYQMGLMGKKDLALAPDLRSGLEMALLKMLAFRPEGIPEPLAAPVLANTAVQVESENQTVNTEPPAKKPEAQPVKPQATEQVAAIEEVPELQQKAQQQAEQQVALAAAEQKNVSPESVSTPSSEQPVSQPEPSSQQQVAEPIAEQVVEKSPEPEPVAVNEPSSALLSLEGLQTHQQWLASFKLLPISGLLKSVVAECVLQGQQQGSFSFLIDEARAQLLNEKHATQLADLLSACFNQRVAVVINVGEHSLQTPQEYLNEQAALRKAEALENLQNDANVQDILQSFDAEIIEETVKTKL
jgi:DNA polymerase-3 subunit gamma/tau